MHHIFGHFNSTNPFPLPNTKDKVMKYAIPKYHDIFLFHVSILTLLNKRPLEDHYKSLDKTVGRRTGYRLKEQIFAKDMHTL